MVVLLIIYTTYTRLEHFMKTCLIVDDSPFDRRLLRHCVESFDVACLQAASAQEAFGICAEKLPDCILLDWEMPEMNGIEVLRKIRLMPYGSNVIVILCTANEGREHRDKAYAEGANSFIVKPVTVDELEKKFQESGILPTL